MTYKKIYSKITSNWYLTILGIKFNLKHKSEVWTLSSGNGFLFSMTNSLMHWYTFQDVLSDTNHFVWLAKSYSLKVPKKKIVLSDTKPNHIKITIYCQINWNKIYGLFRSARMRGKQWKCGLWLTFTKNW